MNAAPHQVKFADYMQKQWKTNPTFSTILGDTAGGQKTRSALCVVERLATLNPKKRIRCLIVCVEGEDKFWKKEAQYVCPSLKPDVAFTFQRIRSNKKKWTWYEETQPRLVFTTIATLGGEYTRCAEYFSAYDQKPQDCDHGYELTRQQRSQSPLFDVTWDVVVIDEPTFLCHPFWTWNRSDLVPGENGQYPVKHPFARACYALKRTTCILLNGTLFRNSLIDVAAQLYMVCGRAGRAKEWWDSHDEPKMFATVIQSLMSKYVYETSTSDKPTLTAQIEFETVPLALSPVQDEIIAVFRKEAQELFRIDYKSAWEKVTDMCLLCISPQLIAHKVPWIQEFELEDSPKLSFLVTYLLPRLFTQNTKHQQVLVFSRFNKSLVLLRDLLIKHHPSEFGKTGPLMISGQQNADERLETLTRFRSEATTLKGIAHKSWGERILLLTYQIGSRAINLQEGRHIVMLDQSFNPATDEQATKRCHRAGQTEDVTVYRLFMDDPRSPEQWIHNISSHKRFIASTINVKNLDMESESEALAWDSQTIQPTRDEVYQFLFSGCENDVEEWKSAQVQRHVPRPNAVSRKRKAPSSEPFACLPTPSFLLHDDLGAWSFV